MLGGVYNRSYMVEVEYRKAEEDAKQFVHKHKQFPRIQLRDSWNRALCDREMDRCGSHTSVGDHKLGYRCAPAPRSPLLPCRGSYVLRLGVHWPFSLLDNTALHIRVYRNSK
jgi:hypothetical protein